MGTCDDASLSKGPAQQLHLRLRICPGCRRAHSLLLLRETEMEGALLVPALSLLIMSALYIGGWVRELTMS